MAAIQLVPVEMPREFDITQVAEDAVARAFEKSRANGNLGSDVSLSLIYRSRWKKIHSRDKAFLNYTGIINGKVAILKVAAATKQPFMFLQTTREPLDEDLSAHMLSNLSKNRLRVVLQNTPDINKHLELREVFKTRWAIHEITDHLISFRSKIRGNVLILGVDRKLVSGEYQVSFVTFYPPLLSRLKNTLRALKERFKAAQT